MTEAEPYDVRPGEAVVRSTRRQPVTYPAFCDARLRPFRICLDANVDTIITTEFGGAAAARSIIAEYRGVELSDAPRGVLPLVIGAHDDRAVLRWVHASREGATA